MRKFIVGKTEVMAKDCYEAINKVERPPKGYKWHFISGDSQPVSVVDTEEDVIWNLILREIG